jgi:hypothetical protein
MGHSTTAHSPALLRGLSFEHCATKEADLKVVSTNTPHKHPTNTSSGPQLHATSKAYHPCTRVLLMHGSKMHKTVQQPTQHAANCSKSGVHKTQQWYMHCKRHRIPLQRCCVDSLVMSPQVSAALSHGQAVKKERGMRDSTTWRQLHPLQMCKMVPLSKPILPLTAEYNTKEYSGVCR